MDGSSAASAADVKITDTANSAANAKVIVLKYAEFFIFPSLSPHDVFSHFFHLGRASSKPFIHLM